MSSAHALFITACASGQGKTTVTAGIARHELRRGQAVRVFKTGPDFIDPMILERASGHRVYQLDLWMGGVEHCRALLESAAAQADLILIEGVMGLYDGSPSSADLAECFDVPIAAVIDASAMAQTFGAVAHGLSRYRSGLAFHGVLANRVAGEAHAAMLSGSLKELDWLGFLPQDSAMALPDRHLGLVQPSEIADLEARLDRAADAFGTASLLEQVPVREFRPPCEVPEVPSGALRGVHLAVARDEAFSFIYPANLDLLEAMGANLEYFSPLSESLPQADALYLPGGYPELHAARLAANHPLREALRDHVKRGKPALAECGGMMLLFDYLIDLAGQRHEMAGVLPGETAMQPTLQALALQAVSFEQGELRGHSFHHSRTGTSLVPARWGRTQYGKTGEAVFQRSRLTASYIHFYWPSNPAVLAALLAP